VARNHALSEADKAQRRVILLGGDTPRPDAREVLEKVGVARLNKPFRATAVWWVVQQA